MLIKAALLFDLNYVADEMEKQLFRYMYCYMNPQRLWNEPTVDHEAYAHYVKYYPTPAVAVLYHQLAISEEEVWKF